MGDGDECGYFGVDVILVWIMGAQISMKILSVIILVDLVLPIFICLVSFIFILDWKINSCTSTTFTG